MLTCLQPWPYASTPSVVLVGSVSLTTESHQPQIRPAGHSYPVPRKPKKGSFFPGKSPVFPSSDLAELCCWHPRAAGWRCGARCSGTEGTGLRMETGRFRHWRPLLRCRIRCRSRARSWSRSWRRAVRPGQAGERRGMRRGRAARCRCCSFQPRNEAGRS